MFLRRRFWYPYIHIQKDMVWHNTVFFCIVMPSATLATLFDIFGRNDVQYDQNLITVGKKVWKHRWNLGAQSFKNELQEDATCCLSDEPTQTWRTFLDMNFRLNKIFFFSKNREIWIFGIEISNVLDWEYIFCDFGLMDNFENYSDLKTEKRDFLSTFGRPCVKR